MHYSINVKGCLLELEKPVVMGILNVTDDSFYSGSRTLAPQEIAGRVKAMLDAGAGIVDVGACSTRPGCVYATEKEELRRLHLALDIIDKEFPAAVVSVDTFRAAVVEECVRSHNVSIINDVSGYEWDAAMFGAVVSASLPYILTHSSGPAGEGSGISLQQVLTSLAAKMWELRQAGVADIIIDPGFGFGKSVEENYRMLASLQEFSMLDAPLLVGVSRKSMITKLLGVKSEDALAGTMALNTVALEKGASILRVHDVKEAVQAVAIAEALKGNF